MMRSVQANPQGYLEVGLSYRKNRAAFLDAKAVPERERLVCPMIDAARSSDTYGGMFLPETNNKTLKKFATAVKPDKSLNTLIIIIAWVCNKWYQIPRNIIMRSFDAQGINTGLLFNVKKHVHTGIFKDGKFSQDMFNKFVWNLYPELEGQAIDNDFVYSEKADGLYFYESELDKVVAYNKKQSYAKNPSFGVKASTFEMQKLLLGILGQKLTEGTHKGENAILIRDMHDLYKYALVTAHIENQLETADLLSMPTF